VLNFSSLSSAEQKKTFWQSRSIARKKLDMSKNKETEITEIVDSYSFIGRPTKSLFEKAYKTQTVEKIEKLHHSYNVSFEVTIDGFTPLDFGVRFTHAPLVFFLIDKKRSSISKKLDDNRTALSAISWGKTDERNPKVAQDYTTIVRKLIKHGCSINEVGPFEWQHTSLARYISENWLEIRYDDTIIKEYVAQGAALVTKQWQYTYNIFIPLLQAYGENLQKHSATPFYRNQVSIIIKAILSEKMRVVQTLYVQALFLRKKLAEEKNITLPKRLVLSFADMLADERMDAILKQLDEAMNNDVNGWIQSPRKQLTSSVYKPHAELDRLTDVEQWRNDWQEFKQYKEKCNQPNMIAQAFNKQ
jgi:hypothetical protein